MSNINTLVFFKALADQTRLALVALIYQEQEICVCQLTEVLRLSQAKISRHLAILKTANIVQGRKAGKWVYYRVVDNLADWQLASIAAAINELTATQDFSINTKEIQHIQLKQCC